MSYDYKQLIDYIENDGDRPSILDCEGLMESTLGPTINYHCLDKNYNCIMEYIGKTGCRMIPIKEKKFKKIEFSTPDLIVLYKELTELFDKKKIGQFQNSFKKPECVKEYWKDVMFKCDYKPNGLQGRDSLICGILLYEQNIELRICFHNFNPFVESMGRYGDPNWFVECRTIQDDLNEEWDYRNFRM